MHPNPIEVVFPVECSTPEHSEVSGREAIFSYHAGPAKVPGPWKRGRPRGDKLEKQSTQKRVNQDSTSQTAPFEFVHLSPNTRKLDTRSKNRIRSHVRRGRPAKIPTMAIAQYHHPPQSVPIGVFVEHYNLRQIDGVDPFNILPIHFEPYMHDLLFSLSTTVWKTLYTLEWAVGFNPFVEYGLPMGLADPALMHTFISCADTFLSYFSRHNYAARSLWHLHRAISIVNKRLEATTTHPTGANRGQIDGSTIIMVAGIAMFERGHDHPENWKLHMEGLTKLVQYYGGIERIHDQPYVLQKIFRADLYGCLENDEPTYFDGHTICSQLTNPLPSNEVLLSFHNDGFNRLSLLCSGSPILLQCISELDKALKLNGQYSVTSSSRHPSQLMNYGMQRDSRRQHPTSVAATQIRYLLTGAQYLLLSSKLRHSIVATEDPLDRQKHEICRVGLLLFSLTALNERPAYIDYGLPLVQNLCNALMLADEMYQNRSICAQPPNPDHLDLVLWSVSAAISVIEGDSGNRTSVTGLCISRLQHIFSNAIQKYGPKDFGVTNLQARVRRYPWVAGIFDDSLHGLLKDSDL